MSLRISLRIGSFFKNAGKIVQLTRYAFIELTVLRIEQGTRFVPDYEVVALAEYFQVSCEYLLGVKAEK